MYRCAASSGAGERERRDAAAERRRVLSTTQETQAVHALPDDGPRTGVRQQLVHNAAETLGDRVSASSQRAAGQGLVSEPANEVQEAEGASKEDDIPRRRRVVSTVGVVAISFFDVVTFCAAPHVAMTSPRGHLGSEMTSSGDTPRSDDNVSSRRPINAVLVHDVICDDVIADCFLL